MTRGKSDFDLSRLPREEILAAVFPGQAIPLNRDGLAKVRCVWPGCIGVRHRSPVDQHPNGLLNPTRGTYQCTLSGARASGWRELVEGVLGREAWARYRERCLPVAARPAAKPGDLAGQWAALEPERLWTTTYGIRPELAARYLRRGARLPGEVVSESVLGCYGPAGTLVGLKFRLPPGQQWRRPPKPGAEHDKYLAAKGSSVAGVVFLGDRIAEGATVVVCAGEKDALVAASHLDPARWAPVSGCVGEQSRRVPERWREAITAACYGRAVVIAYDPDPTGRAGAWLLAEALAGRAASVRCAQLPQGGADLPAGEARWDVAGLVLARGAGALEQLLEQAGPVPPEWRPAPPPPGLAGEADEGEPGGEPEPEAGEGRDSAATQLVRLAQEQATLFHDELGNPFIVTRANGIRRVDPLGSRLKNWLAAEWWRREGQAVAPSAAESALATLRGLASVAEPAHEAHVRVARHEGRIYLDLCDDAWRVVDIGPEGWQVVSDPPVYFRRREGMLALPEPVRGGSLDELVPLLNVPDEATWVKLKAWLVQAARGRGPYFVLLAQGEHGSGKSTLARVLRSVFDPNKAAIRGVPKDEEDLIIAANASQVVCLDNLSGCPAWLSDGLCRLATGAGFSTRRLYTNDEECLFWAERPILLNGIDELASRPDLADRSLLVQLPEVPDEGRLEVEALEAQLAALRPRLLGALCDALSCGLRRWGEVRLAKAPRMADAARWVVAASPALGLPDAAFPEVIAQDRAEQDLRGAEGDPVAGAIRRLLAERPEWIGPTEELLECLTDLVGPTAAKAKDWPRTSVALGRRLTRQGPVLRRLGVYVGEVEWDSGTRRRIRVLRRALAPDCAGSSEGI